MWRETNVFGIFLPPIIVYMLAALILLLALRVVLLWVHAYRWIWNSALAETALYVCILGALLTWA